LKARLKAASYGVWVDGAPAPGLVLAMGIELALGVLALLATQQAWAAEVRVRTAPAFRR